MAQTASEQEQTASEQEKNAEVVRRYLRVFKTRDMAELRAVMAEDVEAYGAGMAVRGRHHVEQVVCSEGLTVVAQEIVELHACADRVTVAVAQTYRQDRTGKLAVQSACKMYQLTGGVIVRFWGESDLFGLLRQLDLLPDEPISFA
jgi:ketosteroid isomerase-like protein